MMPATLSQDHEPSGLMSRTLSELDGRYRDLVIGSGTTGSVASALGGLAEARPSPSARRVNNLAAPIDRSLPSISKPIKVLERAGLITWG